MEKENDIQDQGDAGKADRSKENSTPNKEYVETHKTHQSRAKSAAPAHSKSRALQNTRESRCKSSSGSRGSSLQSSSEESQFSAHFEKRPKSRTRKRYGVFTNFEEVEKAYGRYPVKFKYNPVFTPRITGYSHCWNAQRWDQTYYNEHRSKVAEARPMVDTKPPRTHMHLHLKLKKLQLEEERLATIERDNRILLEKMSFIMRTQGRVDNRNDYEYKSLNREKRTRELLRVTRENQEILGRIMKKRPEYDHKKWQGDWMQNQIYMDNISSFPKEWWRLPSAAPTSRPPQTTRQQSRQSTSRRSKKSAASVQEQEQMRADSPVEEKD